MFFSFFLWMFQVTHLLGFLTLVGFASSLGQVSWLCLTQCIGFSFSYFKQISMPSLLVFTFLLPSFTMATTRSLCILFVLCRILFYVIMYNLKICCGCYSKLYFSFYENLHFLQDFISMSGAGRGWGKITAPSGFGGGGTKTSPDPPCYHAYLSSFMFLCILVHHHLLLLYVVAS